MPRSFTHDVAIVGASIAGATLAHLLAQQGFHVALLDRNRFPRNKPCGEGLSQVGLQVLRRAGLVHVVESAPHVPYSGFAIWPRGATVPCIVGGNEAIGIGIERYVLDAAVLSEIAKNPEVDVTTGAAVRQIAALDCAEGYILPEFGIRSRYLVFASGIRPPLAEKLGFTFAPPRAMRFGLRMLFKGDLSSLAPRVGIFLHKGYEIYCTPVSDDLLNVAVIGRKDAISATARDARLGELSTILEKRCRTSLTLLSELQGIGPLGGHAHTSSIGSALLVGDALESLDPLGGMGMTHALLCAELAAEALVRARADADNPAAAFAAYAAARNAAMRPLRGFTRLICSLLRPRIGGELLPYLNHPRIFATLEGALLPAPRPVLENCTRALLSGIGTMLL